MNSMGQAVLGKAVNTHAYHVQTNRLHLKMGLVIVQRVNNAIYCIIAIQWVNVGKT